MPNLELNFGGKFRGKIGILSTHNLLCRKCAGVCRKIATSWLPSFVNPRRRCFVLPQVVCWILFTLLLPSIEHVGNAIGASLWGRPNRSQLRVMPVHVCLSVCLSVRFVRLLTRKQKDVEKRIWPERLWCDKLSVQKDSRRMSAVPTQLYRQVLVRARISYGNTVRLSVRLSRPGTDSRPGEIETPGLHHMIAYSL